MRGVQCFSEAAASDNSNKEDEATHKHEPLVQLLRAKVRPIPQEGSAQVPPTNPEG